jgi:hypothetical protein
VRHLGFVQGCKTATASYCASDLKSLAARLNMVIVMMHGNQLSPLLLLFLSACTGRACPKGSTAWLFCCTRQPRQREGQMRSCLPSDRWHCRLLWLLSSGRKVGHWLLCAGGCMHVGPVVACHNLRLTLCRVALMHSPLSCLALVGPPTDRWQVHQYSSTYSAVVAHLFTCPACSGGEAPSQSDTGPEE